MNMYHMYHILIHKVTMISFMLVNHLTHECLISEFCQLFENISGTFLKCGGKNEIPLLSLVAYTEGNRYHTTQSYT